MGQTISHFYYDWEIMEMIKKCNDDDDIMDKIRSFLRINREKLSMTDIDGNTPLLLALKSERSPKTANMIIELIRGYDHGIYNISNKYLETPLILASKNKNIRAVNTLLVFGAHVNKLDKSGSTALFYASSIGYVPLVKLLLQNGADSTIVNSYGLTPLDYAICSDCENKLEIIKLLIEPVLINYK